MSVLCTPGVESSCIPANKREGCPSEPEGRTIEDSGNAAPREMASTPGKFWLERAYRTRLIGSLSFLFIQTEDKER